MSDPTASPLWAVAGYPDQVDNPSPFTVTYSTNGSGILANFAPGVPEAQYYDAYIGRAPDQMQIAASKINLLYYQYTGLTHGQLYYVQIVAYQGPRSSMGSTVTQVVYS